jgi:trk system potassium uptake protein TrkA
MYIIIIGCGETGSALAKHLSSEGHEIVVVEEDEERAKALAEHMDALVIHGDGSKTEILRDAGIERADSVAILTRDDNTNLTICQIVKRFNVKRVVARVNDPSKQDLYIGLEITAAISPIAAIVSYFKNAITHGRGRSVISIEKGKAEIVELRMTNSALDGRKIKDIGMPSGALIGLVSREGSITIGSSEFILRTGDLLTVISKTEDAKEAITLLKGAEK